MLWASESRPSFGSSLRWCPRPGVTGFGPSHWRSIWEHPSWQYAMPRSPPDAAHLPERFGLFTIILLGESIVAVMHGMESQEYWSVSAALSAFLGMGIVFC